MSSAQSEPLHDESSLRRKKMPLWMLVLLASGGAITLAALIFVGLIYYSITHDGHTRDSPAFQGFKGRWIHHPDEGAPNEYLYLEIESVTYWHLRGATPAGDESVIDDGTWKELPGGDLELKSASQTRIAKFEPGDEWVLYIDGVKYGRVVK